MKKILLLILSLILILTLLACAGDGGEGTSTADPSTETSEPEELDDPLKLDNVISVSVDTSKTHQTIESFGASGAGGRR